MERIEHAILQLRGQRVMLDSDLAALYGVPTGRLVEAVKRHASRFPADFMFQLTAEEQDILRSQIAISNEGRGGRRYLPYAFTEQGVAMLSSVLNSAQAVAVNIEIIRAFVRMRSMLAANEGLSRRLDELETKYDRQFQGVFAAIRELMSPPAPAPARRKLGFGAADRD
jgi:hypothetical protein